MIVNSYTCDICGSTDKSSEYKENPLNFKQFAFHLYFADGSSQEYFSKHICLDCWPDVKTTLNGMPDLFDILH